MDQQFRQVYLYMMNKIVTVEKLELRNLQVCIFLRNVNGK